MEGYIKTKIELTNEMSYNDAIKKYGIKEYDPQDLTVGISGIILTVYKKSNGTNQVNKYI